MKETGNPEVDGTDVVDRGWGELWMEFSESSSQFLFLYPAIRDLPRASSRSLVSDLSCPPLRGRALCQDLFRGATGYSVCTTLLPTSKHLTSLKELHIETPSYSNIAHTQKLTTYPTTLVDRAAAGHRPPDTVVGVASLAKSDILYECEVWAIVH